MLKERPKTDTVLIHCSLTKPSQNIDAKYIDKLHRQKGCQYGIGYHYFIKQDGHIQPGRDLMLIGAHTPGWDTRSIGICLEGGLSEKKGVPENNFSKEQFTALAVLIRDFKTQWPNIRVIGHGDLISGKDCPCFDVSAFV